jgi:hypothetical protein
LWPENLVVLTEPFFFNVTNSSAPSAKQRDVHDVHDKSQHVAEWALMIAINIAAHKKLKFYKAKIESNS